MRVPNIIFIAKKTQSYTLYDLGQWSTQHLEHLNT